MNRSSLFGSFPRGAVDPVPVGTPAPRPLVRLAAVACFLLAPVGVTSAALWAEWHATLADCVPVSPDEVHYWNEIACFARAGFHGGYCVPDERTAPAAWSHFGAHGPGFPVVYGLPAKVVGWRPASGPFFNVAVVALASVAWLWLARPSTVAVAAAAGLIAVFWPLVLYLPSTFQEALHCAIALVLAGLLHGWTTDERPGRLAWLFPAVVAVAAVVRLTWALAFIPWACVAARAPGRTRVVTIATTAVAVPGLAFLWSRVCSPYPSFVSELIESFRTSPRLALAVLNNHLSASLSAFFSFEEGGPVLATQRFEIVGVVLYAAWRALRVKPEEGRPYVFATLNLAVTTAAVVTLYDVQWTREFRVLAPHLLLSLLVLLSAGEWRPAVAVAVVNLLMVAPFLSAFVKLHEQRPRENPRAAAARAAFAAHLEFDPAAPPWSNTLLLRTESLGQIPLDLPPGIGVSYIVPESFDRFPLPPKSRYVLLGPAHRTNLERRGPLRLRWLAKVYDEDLWLNLDENTGGK